MGVEVAGRGGGVRWVVSSQMGLEDASGQSRIQQGRARDHKEATRASDSDLCVTAAIVVVTPVPMAAVEPLL